MRDRALVVAIVLVFFLVAPALMAARQAPLPDLTQPVNDFANVIPADRGAEIERVIRALQSATGDVVVVATVETIASYHRVHPLHGDLLHPVVPAAAAPEPVLGGGPWSGWQSGVGPFGGGRGGFGGGFGGGGGGGFGGFGGGRSGGGGGGAGW